MYQLGDPVIFRLTKHSPHPGPRAQLVHPSRQGENYIYVVDKFWRVADTTDDKLLLTTRRGKQHVVDADDPRLRHAHWWERLLYGKKFPQAEVGNRQQLSTSS